MSGAKLICVDCYEKLEPVVMQQLNIFYCKNTKCRRFGVLTVGGLLDTICEKRLVLGDDKTTTNS
ncbi:MAG TPA: hypothetical protein VMB78_08335 [Dissulfurispiraceae bacterium]|nr:hypothetical protein [Dissulfurispiraceae bacterium]